MIDFKDMVKNIEFDFCNFLEIGRVIIVCLICVIVCGLCFWALVLW